MLVIYGHDADQPVPIEEGLGNHGADPGARQDLRSRVRPVWVIVDDQSFATFRHNAGHALTDAELLARVFVFDRRLEDQRARGVFPEPDRPVPALDQVGDSTHDEREQDLEVQFRSDLLTEGSDSIELARVVGPDRASLLLTGETLLQLGQLATQRHIFSRKILFSW